MNFTLFSWSWTLFVPCATSALQRTGTSLHMCFRVTGVTCAELTAFHRIKRFNAVTTQLRQSSRMDFAPKMTTTTSRWHQLLRSSEIFGSGWCAASWPTSRESRTQFVPRWVHSCQTLSTLLSTEPSDTVTQRTGVAAYSTHLYKNHFVDNFKSSCVFNCTRH